jgi:serine/threonine-protein kinase PknK
VDHQRRRPSGGAVKLIRVSGSERELNWLRKACDLTHQLVDVHEPRRLLTLILESAVELAGAERGFLIRIVDQTIKVEVARGFDGAALEANSGAVSRRVVQQVIESREGLVTLDEHSSLLEGTTVRSKRVLAIICVPMRVRGEIVGAIYLDHRFLKDPFQRGDLEPLRLFADQAALALEMAEREAAREETELELERAHEALRERESADRRRQRQLTDYRAQRESGDAQGFGALIGESPAALRLFAEIERGARSSDPLLITGETGTGKSCVVRELRRLVPGSDALVCEQCASLDPADLATLLAGSPAGLLALEGVEDASPELQATLLAGLRARGPEETVRVVVTGPQDLHTRIREDLYFRLAVSQIEVPALRERREDIPLLLAHAAGQTLDLTANALQLLVDYGWPGNVLELEGVARQLGALGKKATRRDLPEGIRNPSAPASGAVTMADMEVRMVQEALEACGGNKAQAARRLGIQRSTLYRVLSRLEGGK